MPSTPPTPNHNVVRITGWIGPVPIRLSIVGLSIQGGGIVATQADLDNLHALTEKLKKLDVTPEGDTKS